MRTLLLAALGAVGLLVACSPCVAADPITPIAASVCLRADAGQPVVGAPFTIFANHNVGEATCTVGVDGGAIVLSLTATGAGSCGPGLNAARVPWPARCVVPALDAGSYTFDTVPPSSLTLPYDAGSIPECMF